MEPMIQDHQLLYIHYVTVNPPISATALLQKTFNFWGAYERAVLISKLNEKRIEMMCQNLFTGRVVQNVVEIIILFFFFFYHDLKIRLSIIRKGPLFQEIRYFFVFVRAVGSSLY